MTKEISSRNTNIGIAELSAAIVIGIVSVSSIFVLPGLLSVLGNHFELSDQDIGLVAAADINGIAASMVVLSAFIHRIKWPLTTILGFAIFVAGNLATYFATSVDALFLSRLISGVGGGIALSVAFAIYGRSRSPDQAFGVFLVCGMLFSSLGLYLIPVIDEAGGLGGLILVLIALALSAMACARLLPDSGAGLSNVSQTNGSKLSKAPVFLIILGVAAASSFMLAEGAVWAFVDRIGLSQGLEGNSVARSLALSSIAGIGGGLAAAVLQDRIGRSIPLTISAAASGYSLWLFATGSSLGGFLFAACIFNFCWNFSQALMSGVLAELDDKGRAVVLMGAAQTAAFGLGPAAVGLMLSGQNYAVVSKFGAIATGVSLILILAVIFRQRR